MCSRLCSLAKMTAAHYRACRSGSSAYGRDPARYRQDLRAHLRPQLRLTDEGQLLGHIIIALRMMDDKMRRFPDFPSRLRTLVEHMIVSHHGELEFGSPKVPLFPEALLLHHLDNLDSKWSRCGLPAKDRHVEGAGRDIAHRSSGRFSRNRGIWRKCLNPRPSPPPVQRQRRLFSSKRQQREFPREIRDRRRRNLHRRSSSTNRSRRLRRSFWEHYSRRTRSMARIASKEIPPPLELQCLKALWILGEANVKEVRQMLLPTREARLHDRNDRARSPGATRRREPAQGRALLSIHAGVDARQSTPCRREGTSGRVLRWIARYADRVPGWKRCPSTGTHHCSRRFC